MGSLAGLPLPLRWMVAGAGGSLAAGAVVGLYVGLAADPATAWFALLELGLPAGIVGGAVGLVAGGLAAAVRRLMR